MKIPLHVALGYLGLKPEKINIRDASFIEQDRFVMDPSRYITAQCSRRAGKSNALALKFFRTLESHPKSLCLYIALTRESARNIMWEILKEHDEKYGVGCLFTESNLTMAHPNGSRLQLFGADMKNFIRRLRGIKTPGVAIDEAQDFGSHLQSLIEDVLTPTLTDYPDSWLAIVGTPGPIPMGYFFDITFNQKNGFSYHSWTLRQNKYLPFAEDFIRDLKEKRAWKDNHPTYLREWCNQWVLDKESLLIHYEEEKNHYDQMPMLKKSTHWIYILGVDIGFKDSDALAVLAWSEFDPNIYLCYEKITSGQDISSLALEIHRISKMYDISKIVMDTGGLGKKVAEEIIRRHQLPIQAADKVRKMENVALLNDWLRLGRFKAKKDSQFAKDSYQLQIDWEKTTPDKIKIKETFHSDIIDAVLYAFKESYAFTYQKPEIKPPYQSKEWADQEVELMEKAELEALEKQKEYDYDMDWKL